MTERRSESSTSAEAGLVRKDYSPFTPGQPVPVEFFVGRMNEIRRVFDRLLKRSIGTGWFEQVKSFLGSRVKEVGLFGVTVEFDSENHDLRRIADDFLHALRALIDKLRDEKKGIFLVLDDINGLANSEEFANWLKSLVDEIATSDEPIPLCLLVVGLEEKRQALISLQPSLARVFHVVRLQPWSENETKEFYVNSFGKIGVAVDEAALDVLARYSGGLPVLAHEMGEAIFRLDEDGRIDESDALKGVLAAADIIGQKHLEPKECTEHSEVSGIAAFSAKSRKIDLCSTSRARRMLANLSSEESRAFDNFLRRMKELGVLVPDSEGGPGSYRFVNDLYCIYTWLEGKSSGQAMNA